MADYIIERISKNEPKPVYSDKYKSTTYYIKCMLQGHSRPVEIGKKKPDALREGMTVSGTIIDKPEFEVDGWRADPVAFGGGQQGSFGGGIAGSFVPTSQKPAYKDNSDGQRQGMCFNNAANYVNSRSISENKLLSSDKWAETVHQYANALYKLGDLGGDGGSTSDSLKAQTSPTTSKPWQVNTRDPDAKLWPSDHIEDDAEAVSLYQTFAGAEEVPPEEYDMSQIPY